MARGPSLLDMLYNDAAADWQPEPPRPIPSSVQELAIDTESDGLQTWKGHRPIGVSYAHAGDKQYLPFNHRAGGNLPEDQVKTWCKQELRGKRLVFANAKHDVKMFRAWGVDLEDLGCTFGDVQHYAALLDDSRRQFNLNLLAKDFLGETKVGMDLDGEIMAEYHAGVVAPRAVADADQTFRIHEKMWARLTAEDLHRVRELEDDLIPAVVEMELNAAPIDTRLLDYYERESKRRYEYCVNKIQKDLSIKFNANPNDGASWERLFSARKCRITHYTDKGAPSFADDVIRDNPDPYIQLGRWAAKLSSLRSKFITPYDERVGNDGLLRYQLHQLRSDEGGTISGRFSSSSVNIQQVMTLRNHKKAFEAIHVIAKYFNDEEMLSWSWEDFQIRKLFIAEDGEWYSADMEQIEYRIFAHYANSAYINAAYAKDPWTDFHNIVMEMVRKVKESIDRKATKDLNFAMIFGAGINKIALMLGVPYGEAQALVRAYKAQFPEAKKLIDFCMNLAKDRGYVRTFLGRRARFPHRSRLHKSLNSVVQGGAADVNKRKLREVYRSRKQTGFVLRFTVHDELNGDAPDKRCAEMVSEILNMQTSPEIRIPILWKPGLGQNWAEAH